LAGQPTAVLRSAAEILRNWQIQIMSIWFVSARSNDETKHVEHPVEVLSDAGSIPAASTKIAAAEKKCLEYWSDGVPGATLSGKINFAFSFQVGFTSLQYSVTPAKQSQLKVDPFD